MKSKLVLFDALFRHECLLVCWRVVTSRSCIILTAPLLGKASCVLHGEVRCESHLVARLTGLGVGRNMVVLPLRRCCYVLNESLAMAAPEVYPQIVNVFADAVKSMDEPSRGKWGDRPSLKSETVRVSPANPNAIHFSSVQSAVDR